MNVCRDALIDVTGHAIGPDTYVGSAHGWNVALSVCSGPATESIDALEIVSPHALVLGLCGRPHADDGETEMNWFVFGLACDRLRDHVFAELAIMMAIFAVAFLAND